MFCDKCGTLHTPEQCPYNPANAEQASQPLIDTSAVQSGDISNVLSGVFDVATQALMSLPKKAEAVVTSAGDMACTVGEGAMEVAANVGTGTLEAAGSVLEGVGSVAGGLAEAAGDILSGL